MHWKHEIGDSALQFYALIDTKEEFQFEPYPLNILNSKMRISIARFRLSSHGLRIETDRDVKPKPDIQKIICIYCDKGGVDDEINLMTCTFDDKHRNLIIEYVNKLICESSKAGLFCNVMSGKCYDVMWKLGQFLRLCFHDRNTAIKMDET